MSPLVVNSGQSGASSRTIHTTLTWSRGVPAVITDVASFSIASTSACGGEITDIADTTKDTATTIESGDKYVTQLRTAER